METLEKAVLAANFADEKKAEDIRVLDVTGLCNFTDMFVICTGKNRVQLNAIVNGVSEGFKKLKRKSMMRDVERDASWLVLDYGDVVIHVMNTESRSFYRLENLWGDARQVDWQKELQSSEALSEKVSS